MGKAVETSQIRQEGNSHASDPDCQCADSFRRDSGNIGRSTSALFVRMYW